MSAVQVSEDAAVLGALYAMRAADREYREHPNSEAARDAAMVAASAYAEEYVRYEGPLPLPAR